MYREHLKGTPCGTELKNLRVAGISPSKNPTFSEPRATADGILRNPQGSTLSLTRAGELLIILIAHDNPAQGPTRKRDYLFRREYHKSAIDNSKWAQRMHCLVARPEAQAVVDHCERRAPIRSQIQLRHLLEVSAAGPVVVMPL
jgi:hypothetical protein